MPGREVSRERLVRVGQCAQRGHKRTALRSEYRDEARLETDSEVERAHGQRQSDALSEMSTLHSQ
jgi:hypothetical protein